LFAFGVSGLIDRASYACAQIDSPHELGLAALARVLHAAQ
jgi:hypothetical protein